jgi:hypothetical protein
MMSPVTIILPGPRQSTWCYLKADTIEALHHIQKTAAIAAKVKKSAASFGLSHASRQLIKRNCGGLPAAPACTA